MCAYSIVVQAYVTTTDDAYGYGYDGPPGNGLPPSPTTASLAGYSNLGCWSDTTTRILTGSTTDGTNMEIELCRSL